ncbi:MULTISPECIES: ABC transporter ATP-binding protein [Bacillus cereus group]|uniref:ABC transporter ATP-binding protein n=1 Tax=Bacillus cereus group TaxID=86661 RepID=UPI0001A0C771|nr:MULTISPECIES: ABC transporter ATP-binding protein [Bacillus cereus group]EEL34509.1 ABC transporter, ATP-binding protein [Bacillus cereus Rock3-28]MBJ7949781.1 ABC transporter ATP-binding protein [Bacillus cereus group sp. N24]OSM11130.1 ABC transporter ATP-binding protein [Bacillus toyonensis]UFI00041.1 ABC transporter ATP-binding protein [Bacillus toyonensis]UKS62594.1 ABC transporter ATP-binding protein [Bacillus toyonensis]
MQKPSIVLQNVSKSFGKKEVLHDLSLQIEKAEIFGLVGPSGSGKTTLIKLIAGINQASKGNVFVYNINMPNLNEMKRIGYMAQADALYEELSAYENADFIATMYGLKGKHKKERIKEVFDLVQLSQHMKKQVQHFSGGMKKRLSLAIALLHEPEILILDEPTVGIDPLLRKTIWGKFYELKKKGTTIIVTTHIMDEAEFCERLGLIREGNLVAVGTPEELKKRVSSGRIEDVFLLEEGVES